LRAQRKSDASQHQYQEKTETANHIDLLPWIFLLSAQILVRSATAVPEMLYPGSAEAKRHFPQENAAFHQTEKGKQTLEPL
jgi:hypothetical protein